LFGKGKGELVEDDVARDQNPVGLKIKATVSLVVIGIPQENTTG